MKPTVIDGVKTYADGSILVKNEPTCNVYCDQVRAVGNKGIVQGTLRQTFKRAPTPGTLLGMFMQGHESFAANTDTMLVTWQNMSRQQMAALGIYGQNAGDWEALDNAPNGVLKISPVEVNVPGLRIVATDSLTPRTWRDENGKLQTQPARQAGNPGPLLTYTPADSTTAKPIYRTTSLAVPGMVVTGQEGRSWDEDRIYVHNPTTGSTAAQNIEQENRRFIPEIGQRTAQTEDQAPNVDEAGKLVSEEDGATVENQESVPFNA